MNVEPTFLDAPLGSEATLCPPNLTAQEQVLQYLRYQNHTIERRPSGFYVRGFLKDRSGRLPTLNAAMRFCNDLPR
ncbi:MAG TPA: hypothetical protein VGD78_15000 [Chthoniobacterales bacterium]